MNIVQYKIISVQYTLYIVHSTLYNTIHSPLNFNPMFPVLPDQDQHPVEPKPWQSTQIAGTIYTFYSLANFLLLFSCPIIDKSNVTIVPLQTAVQLINHLNKR